MNLRHITKKELEGMERVHRLNLVNSLPGYKPANLIGTRSAHGAPNLAIVSSVLHLSSSPATIGFMQRPTTVPRDTYANLTATGYFTINHVHREFIDRAHYTSAKFAPEESEFQMAGLTEEYLGGFQAPFVEESRLKMAVRYLRTYEIEESNTLLVVGSIESIYLPGESVGPDGQLDLNRMETVSISGLNQYHGVHRLAAFPYARPGTFPENLLDGP